MHLFVGKAFTALTPDNYPLSLACCCFFLSAHVVYLAEDLWIKSMSYSSVWLSVSIMY